MGKARALTLALAVALPGCAALFGVDDLEYADDHDAAEVQASPPEDDDKTPPPGAGTSTSGSAASSGAGGNGAPSCATGDACSTCVSGACANDACGLAVAGCSANPSCAQLLACQAACTEVACYGACMLEHAAGVGTYDGAVKCIYCEESTCRADCSTECVSFDDGTMACQSCVYSDLSLRCNAERSACLQNPECVELYACQYACNDAACNDACAAQHPLGIVEIDLMLNCAYGALSPCASVCGF